MSKKILVEKLVPFVFFILGTLILLPSIDITHTFDNFTDYIKELNGILKAVGFAISFACFMIFGLLITTQKKFNSTTGITYKEFFIKIITINLYSGTFIFIIALLAMNFSMTNLALVTSIFGLVATFLNGKHKFNSWLSSNLKN